MYRHRITYSLYTNTLLTVWNTKEQHMMAQGYYTHAPVPHTYIFHTCATHAQKYPSPDVPHQINADYIKDLAHAYLS